jgi:hypothetical protein
MAQSRLLNDKIEALYEEIHDLMWAMVWDICNADRWQLEADEVFGDLSLELVKVCQVYKDKDGLELKSLVIKSLQNRIKDLAVICYGTHRKAESNMLDIDDLVSEPGNEISNLDLEELRYQVSDDAWRLICETLWPSERTKWTLDLFVMRKKAISKNGGWKLKITPLIMERALGWSQEKLQSVWEEVSSILQYFAHGLVCW